MVLARDVVEIEPNSTTSCFKYTTPRTQTNNQVGEDLWASSPPNLSSRVKGHIKPNGENGNTVGTSIHSRARSTTKACPERLAAYLHAVVRLVSASEVSAAAIEDRVSSSVIPSLVAYLDEAAPSWKNTEVFGDDMAGETF